ncbi:hypothetical protein CKY39_03795 [Variovorax boronicumulans]|uniref:Uncharacterized protein n=1 Tax=Variovorax boronicumulans TaxID=436515 RepID=A0A250DDV6_9BURK|nr:hypothetical protein CKY39_03795 [Variovorax boronicumulans]
MRTKSASRRQKNRNFKASGNGSLSLAYNMSKSLESAAPSPLSARTIAILIAASNGSTIDSAGSSQHLMYRDKASPECPMALSVCASNRLA